MGAAAFYFHLLSSANLSKSKRERSIFSLKEIGDGPFNFGHSRDQLLSNLSSIRGDANARGRPQQRNTGPSGTPKGDGHKIADSSSGVSSNSSNREQIISLFKQIEASISKGESLRSKKKRSTKSSEDKPLVESVLDFLHRSGKRLEERSTTDGSKLIDEGLLKKGKDIDQLPKTELKVDHLSAPKTKFTRPPSNFVRRSPIPSRSVQQSADFKAEEVQTLPQESNVEIKAMKLPQLKELAKSRGLKGYSKLKKNELVELLLRSSHSDSFPFDS